MRRQRPRRGVLGWLCLWLWAGIGGLGGCWGDLPSVVVSNGAPSGDAGARPGPLAADVDAARIVLDDPVEGGADTAGTGAIVLTVSLPIEPATGGVVAVGPLHLQLMLSDRTSELSIWTDLEDPPAALITLNLDDVASGGPYTLQVAGTSAQGATCAESSPPFLVTAGETVLLYEALVCGPRPGANADPGTSS